MSTGSRAWRAAGLEALLLLSAYVLPIRAQGPVPPAAPQLTIAVTARALEPGEVVRVDVQSAVELRDVTVALFDREVAAAAAGPGAWRVLLGIDLDVEPGDHEMAVTATTAAGVPVSDRQVLTVVHKEFPTRTLTVDPRFVTPPAGVRPRIEREARRLGAIFRNEGTGPAWPGAFEVPIAAAMVSGFGVRSVFNGEPRAPHGGADFASPAGTPVKSPGRGTVVLAADLYFTGLTVVLNHGGGLYSLFAHLSHMAVHEGQRVARGHVLGTVGATGRATGPHLHWTVRLHNARVDPLSLVYATREAGPPQTPQSTPKPPSGG